MQSHIHIRQGRNSTKARLKLRRASITPCSSMSHTLGKYKPVRYKLQGLGWLHPCGTAVGYNSHCVYLGPIFSFLVVFLKCFTLLIFQFSEISVALRASHSWVHKIPSQEYAACPPRPSTQNKPHQSITHMAWSPITNSVLVPQWNLLNLTFPGCIFITKLVLSALNSVSHQVGSQHSRAPVQPASPNLSKPSWMSFAREMSQQQPYHLSLLALTAETQYLTPKILRSKSSEFVKVSVHSRWHGS